jgi:putative hemolysin
MSDSPLALRMMAAKFAQLARNAEDGKEAERLMAQARRYERLAVEVERALRQAEPTKPAQKAKTPSES